MITVKTPSQLSDLPDGNKFIGKITMKNSSIVFSGKNNVLYCEGTVSLDDSHLRFSGDNAVIYLCGKAPYKISAELYHDSVLYIGKGTHLNSYRPNYFKLSEQKHIFIGEDCLLSFNISFRTADPHLVYDAVSRERLNYSKSIYVGDHVWIGQDVSVLKGTKIHSGSIVGSAALLAGKELPHQTSWGGCPVKKLRDNVYWKRDCVHKWRSEDTQKYARLEDDEVSVLEHDPSHYLSFDELDNRLTGAASAAERAEILRSLGEHSTPDRFVEPPPPAPQKKKFRPFGISFGKSK